MATTSTPSVPAKPPTVDHSILGEYLVILAEFATALGASKVPTHHHTPLIQTLFAYLLGLG